MKINRKIVESYLGQKVEVKLFYGDIVIGYLHKTREEAYKNNPNLSVPKNYYFLEYDNYDNYGNKDHSSLFRVSHIRSIRKIEIDYSTQQFKWAEEIMEERKVNILDINWNKFNSKEEIKKFIDMLDKGCNDLLKDGDVK